MSGNASNSESSTSKTELINFIETARNRGFSDELIYRVLSSRGWSSNEVTSAYQEVLERASALPVPIPHSRGSESARDAFLYLLSFATLAIWSQALGGIGFIFVDQLIPDPLTNNYNSYSGGSYELASSLARLIIVFPFYLFLMRLLSKDLAAHPDKYASGIRKWLTYLALLIAALIVIVDLIIFLTALLRGELTLRFTAKVGIVLVLAGGIFWYYLTWLQRQPVRS